MRRIKRKPRGEITCAKCGWTKMLTQEQAVRHFSLVHKLPVKGVLFVS